MSTGSKVRCIQIREGDRSWWILSDDVRALTWAINNALDQAQAEWINRYGEPMTWIVIRDEHTVDQAAATLADLELLDDDDTETN